VTGLLQDVRYALRGFAKSPGFTAVAVATLALGIGVNTAIFSVTDAILLRPLPYASADRLAQVGDRSRSGSADNIGYATYEDLRARNRTFASLAAVRSWYPTLAAGGEAERVPAMRVTWNYFATLGAHPVLGRDFRREEDRPDTWRVVILSDALWRRRFGADRSIVGRSIRMNDRAYTVVGVMPAAYEPLISAHFYQPAQMWAPMGYDRSLPYACRSCQHLKAFGRLRDGVSTSQAAADLDAIRAQLRREYPKEYPAGAIAVVPFSEELTGGIRPALFVLGGAVGFVLLIACANVANLTLARSVQRSHEMVVRAALGASRGRLVRQLLTESLLLAGAGGAVGVSCALLLRASLVGLSPVPLPRFERFGMDGRVLAFAALASLATGVLCGVIPALRTARAGWRHPLASAARATAGGSAVAARRWLAIADLTLAVVLLAGAGLMLKSMARLLSVPLGFRPEGVVTASVSLNGSAYEKDEPVVAFEERLLEKLRSAPEVTGAALASQIPLGGNGDQAGLHVEGHAFANPADAPSAERYMVTPDYFRVMGIALERGRVFTETDRAGSDPVLLVSKTAARSLFFGEDPIGRRVRVGDAGSGPWRTVVGVVGDVRHADLATPPAPQMYLPQSQVPDSFPVLVIRTIAARPDVLAGAIRQAIHDLDPGVPVYGVATMKNLVGRAEAQRRFAMRLLAGFAAVALLLASIGLYGVVSTTIAQRRKEIGIRVALGAAPADVLSLVLRSGASTVGAGLVLGLLCALALTRFLRSLLFEVSVVDPATLIAATATLTLVAFLTHWAPARRALRVDPIRALRED
jgi:putative ABC transport system permease protein